MKILDKVIAITLCASMALALTACGKDYNGTYRAKLDCTELFSNGFSEGAGMDVTLEGDLEAEFILKMINGEYWLELDADKFEDDMTEYISSNMDNILLALFETDDMSELEEYASYMGYSNYDEMKDAMFDAVMDGFDINDFKLNESGTYIVVGDTIKFDSKTSDDFEGKGKDGEIIIEMADDDEFFGSDTLELVFELEEKI